MLKNYKFQLLLGIINPILYSIDPILLLFSIIFELIVIFSLNLELKEKFIITYLITSCYFGISFLGIKLYDIIAIFFVFRTFFMKRKLNIKECIKLFIISSFLVYITLILFTGNKNNESIPEYIRYFQSVLLIFIIYKLKINFIDFYKIREFVKLLVWKNIFIGISIAFLSLNNFINYSYKNSFLSINIHNIDNEFRITGFFSDPNKYFLFFAILLVIYEILDYGNKKSRVINKFNCLLVTPIILSFSRTAIISIFLFIILKIIAIKILKNNLNIEKLFLFFTLILFICISLTFKNSFLNILNQLIENVTILLGRKDTLGHMDNILNDNRIISSKIAIDSLKNNIIFGNGLSYWKTFYYMPAHNTFISITQELGLIGISFFILINYICLRKVPMYILIALLLLPMIMLDIQHYRLLYFIYGVSINSTQMTVNGKLNT